MRIVLVVLFVLCGVSVFAESQQPTPRPLKSIRNTAQADYKSDKEECGSETNPIFIKQLQSEVKETARNNEGKNVDNNLTAQSWSAIATALFTFILTLSTVALWYSTRALARLSRDEFNATHRPKVIIHTFERTYSEDSTVGVIFTYVNTGTTAANIIEIKTNIFLSDNLAAEDSAVAEEFDKKILKSGEKGIHHIKSNITDMVAILEDMRKSRGQSNQKIMCKGTIRYKDNQGTPRETGFYRAYDGERCCWLRVENSDHEYSY